MTPNVALKRAIRKSVAEAQGLLRRQADVLRALAQRINPDGQCWPSQRTIAEDANLSPRSVWQSLEELEAAGWISRERRSKRTGHRSSDLITLRTLEQAAAWAARKLESLVDYAKKALKLRVGQLAEIAKPEPIDSLLNPRSVEGYTSHQTARRTLPRGSDGPTETPGEMAARWRALAIVCEGV